MKESGAIWDRAALACDSIRSASEISADSRVRRPGKRRSRMSHNEKASDNTSFAAGLRMAFDATMAVLDSDAAGRYAEPLPTDVRAMLERHSHELAKAAVDAGILEEGAG